MRTEHALRYILLKHVWKLRGSTDEHTRREVARSLLVDRGGDGLFHISWTRAGDAYHIQRPTAEFQFYKRGDGRADDDRPTGPPGNVGTEGAARRLAAEMLGVVVPVDGRHEKVSLYLDSWRWPTLCGVAGSIALLAFHSVVPLVFAGTTLVEPSLTSHLVWLPFAAALVLEQHTISAIVVSAVLMVAGWLASTGPRGWIDAAPYAVLSVLAWLFRAGPTVAQPSPAALALVAVGSIGAWVVLWLWYEGRRLSILIAPVLPATLLFDGRADLAAVQLALCVTYSVWLVAFPSRPRDA